LIFKKRLFWRLVATFSLVPAIHITLLQVATAPQGAPKLRLLPERAPHF